MSAVNKVNFLLQAASLFPPNGHINQLLKSHYLSTSREVAEKNVELPKKEFGEKRMCEKCSAIWLDGNLKLKICSKKLKKQRLKNLIAKVEASELLSRKQRAKAKWLKKNSQSRVEITCLLCKHKTKLHLEKPKKRNDSTPSQPLQATCTTPATASQDSISLINSSLSSSSSSIQKKATKRKKKDKFAGLNPSVVAQATTMNSSGSSSNIISVVNPTPSTSKTFNTSTLAKPSVESSASNNRKVGKSILPQSHNIEKSKKKNKTKIPNAGQTAVKEVSKTQQKNTLLQLAQLLKTGASLANKKSNPLENLLR